MMIKEPVRRITLQDVELGKRIKQARAGRGLSQEKLAELLGISFQQVQKYENGTNRVPATRLLSIAIALNVKLEDLLLCDTTGDFPGYTFLSKNEEHLLMKIRGKLTSPQRGIVTAIVNAFARTNEIDKNRAK